VLVKGAIKSLTVNANPIEIKDRVKEEKKLGWSIEGALAIGENHADHRKYKTKRKRRKREKRVAGSR